MPATQPGTGRGKKKDHGFKVSADGRLIIREEEEDAATTKMEEEEGSKGGPPAQSGNAAASGLGQGCARLFIYSLICSFIQTICRRSKGNCLYLRQLSQTR